MAAICTAPMSPQEKLTPYGERTYRSLIAARLASRGGLTCLDVPMIIQSLSERSAEEIWSSKEKVFERYGGEPITEDKKKDKMAAYVPYRITNPFAEEEAPVSDRVRRSRVAAQLASRPAGMMNIAVAVEESGL